MSTRILEILNIIKKNENILVNDIAKMTNLSPTSVRRYISKLEKDGLVTRYHGGVKVTKKDATRTMPVEYKNDIAAEAKNRIAKKAADLMKDDALVFIDSGSTTLPIANYIKANVVVVTCNLTLATELGKKNIRVFLLPGYINAKSESVYSDETHNFVSKMYFDQAFISTYGFDKEKGFTCGNHGNIKRTVLLNSEDKFILCDSSKFGLKDSSKIADLKEVVMITEELTDYLDNNEHIILVD